MDKLKKALSGDDEEEETGIVTQVINIARSPRFLALGSCVASLYPVSVSPDIILTILMRLVL